MRKLALVLLAVGGILTGCLAYEIPPASAAISHMK
jgi:hypothetical protein